MKLSVKVIPNAKHNQLAEENGITKVRLTSPAVEGKANEALIEFLSEHFKIKKSAIKILRGLKSRKKIIELHLKNHEHLL